VNAYRHFLIFAKKNLMLMQMKIREIIRQIEGDGWFHVRTRGSHRQYHHATKPGTVTIAGHPGQDLHPKTLNSILRQAGLK